MERVTEMISGLRYIPRYLSMDEHDQLLAVIDRQPWITDLKRRVQHYGYRYDYRHRAVDRSMYLGALPDWAARLAERLHADGFVAQIPDQLIINEYEPGQGIASHVDCVPCFDDTILSLSLGSACVMLFAHLHSAVQVPVLLEPCSLSVMQGDARYKWKHGIAARKTDEFGGQKLVRGRRVSLTFRTIIR